MLGVHSFATVPAITIVFMCHLEDELTRDGVMPTLYRRYVDDTLAKMLSTEAAVDFLTTLNSLHPNLSFTMELPVDNKIPFIGMEIIKNGTQIETQVYRKPTLAYCCISKATRIIATKIVC